MYLNTNKTEIEKIINSTKWVDYSYSAWWFMCEFLKEKYTLYAIKTYVYQGDVLQQQGWPNHLLKLFLSFMRVIGVNFLFKRSEFKYAGWMPTFLIYKNRSTCFHPGCCFLNAPSRMTWHTRSNRRHTDPNDPYTKPTYKTLHHVFFIGINLLFCIFLLIMKNLDPHNESVGMCLRVAKMHSLNHECGHCSHMLVISWFVPSMWQIYIVVFKKILSSFIVCSE